MGGYVVQTEPSAMIPNQNCLSAIGYVKTENERLPYGDWCSTETDSM